MSNKLQHDGRTPSGRTRDVARRDLLLMLAGLGAVAVLLPGPTSTLAALTGQPTSDVSGPLGPVGAALLIAASMLIWGVLAWTVVVACSAALTRMPGVAGRLGRAVLGRIAPAAARNLLIAAVGAALITQVSACATSGPGDGSDVVALAVFNIGSAAAIPTPTGSAPAPGPAGTAARGVPSPPSLLSPTAPMPALDWPMSALDWPMSADPSQAALADGPSTDGRPASAADLTSTVPTNSGPTNSGPTNPGPTNSGESTTATSTAGTPTGQAAGTGVGPASEPMGLPTARPPLTAPIVPTVPTPALPHLPAAATPTNPTPTNPTPTTPTAPTHGPTQSVSTPGSAPGAKQERSDATAPAALSQAVTVQAGDTLWSIAAGRLPSDASDAQIDTAWRSWYRANSAVIGDDPNLILPGQQLQPPTKEAGRP